MNKDYVDVKKYDGEGYKPLVDYDSWRVAVLTYCEELEIQNLKTMQKHNETDEVFILLSGSCTLFTGGDKETIDDIDCIVMEPFKIYNVKKGVWHTHTLDKQGMVAIVENQNTADDNSPTTKLSLKQVVELQRLYGM